MTEAISGAGTRSSHETVSSTAQEIVGARQRLTVTKLSKVDIAPAFVSALPLSVLPMCKVIAPAAITVPTKVDPWSKVNAPFICQNTLHRLAPLIRKTFANVLVAKAPFIWKINMAVGSP